MLRIITLSILLLVPVLLTAGEFTYQARVISTEPVSSWREVDRRSPECTRQKPEDISGILMWDIGCETPEMVEVMAYEVSYEINDRTFTTTLRERPAGTIPVRLTLF